MGVRLRVPCEAYLWTSICSSRTTCSETSLDPEKRPHVHMQQQHICGTSEPSIASSTGKIAAMILLECVGNWRRAYELDD